MEKLLIYLELFDQIVFILVGFLFIPILISIPYYFSIYHFSFLDAYFESVSGFTTTGFSIIENVKKLDEPLLLWRSSSQWIGGLFFLLSVIGTIGSKQIKIKPAHLTYGGGTDKNFFNNFNFNFIKILLIYSFSTIFIIFLLSVVNIRLLDSFSLAFTSISAGGFLPTNNLTNIIITNPQFFALSIAMIFPIFNFFIFYNIVSRNFNIKDFYEDLHLLILITLLILFLYFFMIPEEGIYRVFFAIVSSFSTSGISVYSTDFDLSLFFILLTTIGGASISTSSGFKYTRFYILLKTSYQEIYRLVKPINIIDKNLYNSEVKIDDQDVKIVFLVFLSFIISIFVLSSILALDYLSFEDSFKLSILTLTNTTNSASYGMANLIFLDLNQFTKISLIFFMILGKVELIAAIYLIKRFIFKE